MDWKTSTQTESFAKFTDDRAEGKTLWLRVSDITAVISEGDGATIQHGINPCVRYIVREDPEEVLKRMGFRP